MEKPTPDHKPSENRDNLSERERELTRIWMEIDSLVERLRYPSIMMITPADEEVPNEPAKIDPKALQTTEEIVDRLKELISETRKIHEQE